MLINCPLFFSLRYIGIADLSHDKQFLEAELNKAGRRVAEASNQETRRVVLAKEQEHMQQRARGQELELDNIREVGLDPGFRSGVQIWGLDPGLGNLIVCAEASSSVLGVW